MELNFVYGNNLIPTTEGTIYFDKSGKIYVGENKIFSANDFKRLVNITYSDLKTLRDDEELVPGTQYRITDYNTTTFQEGTTAAEHQFDIIVTAVDNKTLDENARAIQHVGSDTYFDDSNLLAWELKYTLDNDETKYGWCEITKIYVGDSWYERSSFNDAPNSSPNPFCWSKVSGTGNDYIFSTVEKVKIDDYVSTNHNGTNSTPITDISGATQRGVIYYMKDEFDNYCPYDFKNIQYIDDDCQKYTFYLNDMSTDTKYDATMYGRISGCGMGTDYTQTNVKTFKLNRNLFCFGNGNSKSDLFNISNIRFGEACSNNVLINNGSDISNVIFGNNCSNNNIGAVNNCIIGNNCSNNSISNGCSTISFGDDCSNNNIGYYSKYISFGNDCSNIVFGNSESIRSYYQNITVQSGNKYIYLNCTASTSPSQLYRNILIDTAVNNSTTDYKLITSSDVNQTYKTTYQSANTQVISV